MAATVYAFAGKRFSGKSAASQALIDMGFTDLKFADPLKNMLRAFYETCGLTSEEIERRIEGDLKEEPCEWLAGKTPRYAMQTLGTEWREMISTTLWSDIFVKRVNSGVFGDKIVCSDYRFPHEAEALKQLKAHTYMIKRNLPKDLHDLAGQHASETAVDSLPPMSSFVNSGTLEDLRDFVRDLVEANEAIKGIDFGDLTGTAYYDAVT
ncbi:deoxynucleotide monophosphate kinase [Ruegeria phage vB_RpoS-V10]|nr:deoxynucleotide monophosphate kinase [Roseobacter phage DSS3P8]AWY09196.1 deoxynucleotide monophosphate kinase [Ruegeria phage vB_RpoS-V10]